MPIDTYRFEICCHILWRLLCWKCVVCDIVIKRYVCMLHVFTVCVYYVIFIIYVFYKVICLYVAQSYWLFCTGISDWLFSTPCIICDHDPIIIHGFIFLPFWNFKHCKYIILYELWSDYEILISDPLYQNLHIPPLHVPILVTVGTMHILFIPTRQIIQCWVTATLWEPPKSIAKTALSISIPWTQI